jgi:hypothetical protein
MANTYDIGDIVRLSASYTDTGGTPANPTTVAFVYERPSGSYSTETSTGPNVTNPSVGSFHLDVEIDEAGLWEYRVTSAGSIQASTEDYFIVRARRVP